MGFDNRCATGSCNVHVGCTCKTNTCEQPKQDMLPTHSVRYIRPRIPVRKAAPKRSSEVTPIAPKLNVPHIPKINRVPDESKLAKLSKYGIVVLTVMIAYYAYKTRNTNHKK